MEVKILSTENWHNILEDVDMMRVKADIDGVVWIGLGYASSGSLADEEIKSYLQNGIIEDLQEEHLILYGDGSKAPPMGVIKA